MVRTEIWHVTPESNIETIEKNGLRPGPLTMKPYVGTPEDGVSRLSEGIYVCGSRRAMEAYSRTCLDDVRQEMEDGERFALYKATIDRSRLHSDPEWEIAEGGHPKAAIVEGAIEEPELVTVGVLE